MSEEPILLLIRRQNKAQVESVKKKGGGGISLFCMIAVTEGFYFDYL